MLLALPGSSEKTRPNVTRRQTLRAGAMLKNANGFAFFQEAQTAGQARRARAARRCDVGRV